MNDAHASVSIAASKTSVWTALLDPQAIKQYMFGATVRTDWTPGSPITWKGEWNGKPYEDKGVVLEVEAPRTLRYSHFSPLSGLPDEPQNYHEVKIELTDDGTKTMVDLSQTGNASDEARAHSAENWMHMLEGLKKFVER